jgi:hypothetical protein
MIFKESDRSKLMCHNIKRCQLGKINANKQEDLWTRSQVELMDLMSTHSHQIF